MVGVTVCTFYFPLGRDVWHIVFFVFLASEKFPPSLGGEEGLKMPKMYFWKRAAVNTHLSVRF